MDREEMIEILEGIARDPDVNATARCTAIRTLLEIPVPPAYDNEFADLYPDEFTLRRKGRANNG